MKHELTMNEIAKFQKEYEQKPQNRVAELAVVNNGVAIGKFVFEFVQ